MVNEEESDILYGDLENCAKDAIINKLVADNEQLKSQNSSLQAEIAQLRDQILCLVEDKTVLETNIVSLYNTAIREVKRKDTEITLLRTGSKV